MAKEQELIEQSVEMIRSKINWQPEIGIVLGSGLGDYAQCIKDPVCIPYNELPGLPASTVQGHAGQFVLGKCRGKNVIAMQGRIHFYEGYSQREIVRPIRMMIMLGIKKMLLTNAAGGISKDLSPGMLMVIKDHINLSGSNPLIGENNENEGPRFPDMSQVYDKYYRELVMRKAAKKDMKLAEGVYMMTSGPCYETPAEICMFETCGADAVGMSTVPEAIVCAHSRIPVLGISCITNMAAGILEQPLNHQEVIETAGRGKKRFMEVVDMVLTEVF